MSSYCHECGEKIDKDDDFCPRCGKNVKENSKGMKLKRKYILLFSIVAVVVIFSILGFPYLSNSSTIGKDLNKDNQKNAVSNNSLNNFSNSIGLEKNVVPSNNLTTSYLRSSRTSATVFVISESELAVAKQTGKALPSAPLIDKTSSPVDISIDTNQPVVGQNGDTFTLKVTLSNVGGGTVFDPGAISFGGPASNIPSIPEDKLNQITIKVDTSLFAGGDSDAGFCRADLKNVELRKGSTVTIPCDIRINRQITSLQPFSIVFTANYGYF